jgi:hypothetical protein
MEAQASWRKSSYTHQDNCVEVAWRKSSHTHEDNCVEVAFSPSDVAVRDSKHRTGPILEFGPGQWLAFLASTSTPP